MLLAQKVTRMNDSKQLLLHRRGIHSAVNFNGGYIFSFILLGKSYLATETLSLQ